MISNTQLESFFKHFEIFRQENERMIAEIAEKLSAPELQEEYLNKGFRSNFRGNKELQERQPNRMDRLSQNISEVLGTKEKNEKLERETLIEHNEGFLKLNHALADLITLSDHSLLDHHNAAYNEGFKDIIMKKESERTPLEAGVVRAATSLLKPEEIYDHIRANTTVREVISDIMRSPFTQLTIRLGLKHEHDVQAMEVSREESLKMIPQGLGFLTERFGVLPNIQKSLEHTNIVEGIERVAHDIGKIHPQPTPMPTGPEANHAGLSRG
ncbi:hypothetical protein EDM53_04445 [Rickettsiales endosymbiont of Peranema trichophorum]|uniref:hypothetical protein n=1 Tax=Rickettsiales endosymbiont of Peranema trichophorum TaxID=2486577 RepID=UPI0010236005|nr:hypothetical protein [Rickettsiales endosymbiont of Peranema trichophorum]RZI45978.1 hypothetical protein EDM53_04445 [Rickettsiales endosymbiont of Peranema trichophorum]